MVKKNILELSWEELEEWCLAQGEKKFRTRQVWQWLWSKGASSFAEMSNLSLCFREKLDQHFKIFWPRIVKFQQSKDGTFKFLIRLEDEECIESVLIPESKHYTLCVSSQVGCVLGCTFCHTGRMGFKRNLKAFEIVAQVILAKKFLQENKIELPLRNIVYMGMGEPLLNWPEVKKSLQILRSEDGLGFSRRKITLSTVGIKKNLLKFAESKLARLALSLHAPTQELRSKIMPKAATWNLEELIFTLRDYPLDKRERITIEYLLLKGVNDTPEHAWQLVKLLRGVRCKINLISYNPWPESKYAKPLQESILAFEKILWKNNYTALLRKSKGEDILAACGQLRAVSG